MLEAVDYSQPIMLRLLLLTEREVGDAALIDCGVMPLAARSNCKYCTSPAHCALCGNGLSGPLDGRRRCG
jgi:hypothetical protein